MDIETCYCLIEGLSMCTYTIYSVLAVMQPDLEGTRKQLLTRSLIKDQHAPPEYTVYKH